MIRDIKNKNLKLNLQMKMNSFLMLRSFRRICFVNVGSDIIKSCFLNLKHVLINFFLCFFQPKIKENVISHMTPLIAFVLLPRVVLLDSYLSLSLCFPSFSHPPSVCISKHPPSSSAEQLPPTLCELSQSCVFGVWQKEGKRGF